MTDQTRDDEKAAGPGKCPICGKPTVVAVRPFCSARCRNVDLHRWLTGRYAIPAEEDDGGESGQGEDGGQG